MLICVSYQSFAKDGVGVKQIHERLGLQYLKEIGTYNFI